MLSLLGCRAYSSLDIMASFGRVFLRDTVNQRVSRLVLIVLTITLKAIKGMIIMSTLID